MGSRDRPVDLTQDTSKRGNSARYNLVGSGETKKVIRDSIRRQFKSRGSTNEPIEISDSDDGGIITSSHKTSNSRNKSLPLVEATNTGQQQLRNSPSSNPVTTRKLNSRSLQHVDLQSRQKQQTSHLGPPRLEPPANQKTNCFGIILPCKECRKENLSCDGEQPCGYCTSGFDCTYMLDTDATGDNDVSEIGLLPVHRPIETHYLDIERAYAGYHHSSKDIENENSDHPSVYVDSKEQPLSSVVFEENALEKFPVNKFEPRTAKDVQDLVEKFQHNINHEQEYWLQDELRRFVVTAQKTDLASMSTTKTNPWRKHIAQLNSRESSLDIDGYSTVQMKTRSEKVWKTVQLPFRFLEVDRTLPLLPKYKSIGHLGPNFLSRNIHTLQAIPYFPDEELDSDDELENKRREELAQAYRNWDGRPGSVSSEFEKQRKCLESVHRWWTAFRQLIATIDLGREQIRKYAELNAAERCKTCGLRYRQSNTPSSSALLSTTDVEKCRWLASAVAKTSKITLWHFVERNRADPNVTKKKADEKEDHYKVSPSLCSICFVHNCLIHGSYIDDDDGQLKEQIFINDPEQQHNVRRYITNQVDADTTKHICGIYCIAGVDEDCELSRVLGIDHVGNWTGLSNQHVDINGDTAGYQNKEPCSTDCFKVRQRRQGTIGANYAQEFVAALTDPELKTLKRTVELYGHNLKLPCIVAQRLKKPCIYAFRFILAIHQISPHQDIVPLPKTSAKAYNTSRANFLDDRPPITPCSHPGPCQPDKDCPCAQAKAHCEWFCACVETCGRRFKGCSCKGSCFDDDRCACWAQNRECDPWLCRCGVLEVLDPSNKYNEELRKQKGCCRNNKVQLDLPARTVKAESDVQGWGLFAGVDMPKNTYIGEYKGEVVSELESVRRGIVYHNVGQEYLFNFNTGQVIDGSMFGNKSRFMNNTQDPKHINIVSYKLIANGVTRVFFYTKHPVKAGDELLYNYQYPADVQARFWEKGAKSNNGGLIPIPKPHLGGTGARTARKTLDKQNPKARLKGKEAETTAMQPQKRKRQIVDDEDEAIDRISEDFVEEEEFEDAVEEQDPDEEADADDDYSEFGTGTEKSSQDLSDLEHESELEVEESDDEPNDNQTVSRSVSTNISNQNRIVNKVVVKQKRRLNPATDRRFRGNRTK